MGRLIPAGTGLEYYRNVKVDRDDDREQSFDEATPDDFPSVVDTGTEAGGNLRVPVVVRGETDAE